MNKDIKMSDAARIRLELSDTAIDKEISNATAHYLDESEIMEDPLLKAIGNSLRCSKCKHIPSDIHECNSCGKFYCCCCSIEDEGFKCCKQRDF